MAKSGPRGHRGRQGKAGARGPRGAPGRTGLKGLIGPVGPPGVPTRPDYVKAIVEEQLESIRKVLALHIRRTDLIQAHLDALELALIELKNSGKV